MYTLFFFKNLKQKEGEKYMLNKEMFQPIETVPFKGKTPEGPYVAPRVRELVRPGSLQQEVADAEHSRELRPPAVGAKQTEVFKAEPQKALPRRAR